eukprot:193056_1
MRHETLLETSEAEDVDTDDSSGSLISESTNPTESTQVLIKPENGAVRVSVSAQSDSTSSSDPITVSDLDEYLIFEGGGDESNVYSVDQAISHSKFGIFQMKMMYKCGVVWACDALEVMLLTFLIPEIREKWKLSPGVDGALGAVLSWFLYRISSFRADV